MSAGETESTAAARGDALRAEFAFEAQIAIAPRLVVGKSKQGDRFVVPITGGTVSGPRLQGEVLPIGADFQLVRPDGGMELEARYLVRANDGALIQIHNHGLVHAIRDAESKPRIYARTAPEFEAPLDSAHAWLNQALFLATLEVIAPDRVKLRFYRVD